MVPPRAQRLAPTGKRILLLERGDYLPVRMRNWDAQTVFVDGAYQATRKPGIVRAEVAFILACTTTSGGNSKVYGAALLRSP